MSLFSITVTEIPIGQPGKAFDQSEPSEEWTPVRVRELSLQEWKSLFNDGLSPYVEIKDAGRDGDGIKFRILIPDDKVPLLQTSIPEDSLDTLIEALQAVKRLRQTY